MRVLVAPDSFKGSLSATDACEAIVRGLLRARPQIKIDRCPMSDGGQGFVNAIASSLGGEAQSTTVCDPLGRGVPAHWILHQESNTAIIELAAASGYERLSPSERNPMNTSSFGTGELIAEALNKGAKSILVGLGDSATIDGGVGICQALGAQFKGIEGHATGGKLNHLISITLSDLHPGIAGAKIYAAYDVEVPLVGMAGAVEVFGKQKGATKDTAPILESGLRHLAHLVHAAGADYPGAGAAGGTAFGMREILGAELVRGVEIVMEFVDFESRAENADLIFTGEGCLDAQTLLGKTCSGVVEKARKVGTPVVLVAGSITGNTASFICEGVTKCLALTDIAPGETQAIAHAADYLEAAAEHVTKELFEKIC